MIKNKNEVFCVKCLQLIMPLEGKSVGKETVECDECPRGKRTEHSFEHIGKCPEKIEEIPSKMKDKIMRDVDSDALKTFWQSDRYYND